jgi:hypothetical protein
MAKSKKKAAVVALKKEITKQKALLRRAMYKAGVSQRKRLRLTIKRLDKAYSTISLLFDDKSCPAYDDGKCVIFGE